MIKFKCEFCGREIEAANKDAGSITKCSNCLREQHVPAPFHQQMRVAREERNDIEPYALKPVDSICEAEPETENTEAETPETDRIEDYSDEPDDGFLSSICLQFSESSLFAMSVVFLILFSIDKNLQNDFKSFIIQLFGQSRLMTAASMICLLIPFGLGMILSIFHAFSKREKGFFEKTFMLFFAVSICAGTGFYLSIYLIKGGADLWLMIFAACNLIYCALLILKFEAIVMVDETDGGYISDRDAAFAEIIFTTMTCFVVLYACRYMFKLHWIITYSICISYITALNAGLANLLKGRR